ncbi:TraB/GumN family protein [Fulvivirga sp.]|uniref:TraB/GumN family protein n=1 Tax=Fulvivirga sp. TaxID=1931237 RepID=UPI0032EDF3E6
MKIAKILTTAALLLSALTIKAQTDTNALLWEISGNGLEEPSYLFGILKFIPADKYYFPENAEAALKKCKVVATETGLDHHSRHEMNKAAHLEHHQSIDEFIGEDYYKSLKSIFTTKLNVSDFKFNMVYSKFKPVMLSTTMTRLALGENIKFYELELTSKAHSMGLVTVSLESIEKEITMLEKMTLESQTNALKHSIDNFDEQVADYKKLVDFYKDGNLHQSLEYTLHPIENDEKFVKHFINERNAAWIPKIESYSKQAPTFYLLGVSHLADEHGVIAKLRNQGYTVKAVQ